MTCAQTMYNYSNYAIAAGAGAVGFLAVKYGALVGPKVAKLVCKISENAAHYGKPLTNFSRTNPLHGVIAGLAISLLANGIITYCKRNHHFDGYPLLRRVVSHIFAGGLVWGLSAAVTYFGLMSSALTLPCAVTLTALALIIDLVYHKVMDWIGEGRPEILKDLTKVPSRRET